MLVLIILKEETNTLPIPKEFILPNIFYEVQLNPFSNFYIEISILHSKDFTLVSTLLTKFYLPRRKVSFL